MLNRREYKGLTWIDLESPTEEELALVAKEYQIHPLVIGELTKPSLRSRVDLYNGFMYLILHFPVCQICYGNRPAEGSDTEEIDFVLGKDFLITVHYQPLSGISEFAAVFQAERLEDQTKGKPHAGLILYHLLRQLYSNLSSGLDYINDVLKKAEKKIFADEERAMVRLLSEVNRNLLDFRWSLKHHREILASLQEISQDFFEDSFRYYLATVVGEYNRIWSMLESNRETFNDLRNTNESLLSIKNNEITKFLTVLAFTFFPLTMITQFFGMNMELPFVSSPHGYLFILVLMLAFLFCMLALAKHRRWL